MVDVQGVAKIINAANTSQMSGGLLLQTYCNSVVAQPPVDFSAIASLKALQIQINDGLITAQGHANYYLNGLQPVIIQNMANIGNYYELNKALPTVLPPGSTEAQWTADLQAVLQASQGYKAGAEKLVASLKSFHGDLSTDTQNFKGIVLAVNTAVGGDNGVLNGLHNQLNSMQSGIDGAIAGICFSGLAILGGAFLICVGAIADFVTAGTTTPAVVGGIGMVVAGISGEAASIATLVSLNKAKAGLLAEEKTLTIEVKAVTSISSGYNSLSDQVFAALGAATAMQNAWEGLVSDITNVIADLTNGVLSPDAVRTLFVTAANAEIANVLTDIATIKTQMAGVAVVTAANDQTVTQVIEIEAAKAA